MKTRKSPRGAAKQQRSDVPLPSATPAIKEADTKTNNAKKLGRPKKIKILKAPTSPKVPKIPKVPKGERCNNNNNYARILQLFSSMFRQHANLYLQEAAVLEKMALYPEEPHLWFESSSFNDSSSSPILLETIDNRILKDNVYQLAKKSYEGMQELKQEMDALQVLVECSMQPEEFDDDDDQSDGNNESLDLLQYQNIIQGKPISLIKQEGKEDSVLNDDPYVDILDIDHPMNDTTIRGNDRRVHRSRDRDELESDDDISIIPI